MNLPQAADVTRNYPNNWKITEDFRPAFNQTYPVGAAVKIATQDLQLWTDARTVVPCAASVTDPIVQGLVSDDWNGFNNTGTFLSNASLLSRGTELVRVTIGGYHSAALVNNTASSVAIANGTFLNPGTTVAGQLQAVSAATVGSTIAYAMLPASGIGSSLGSSTLAQASVTYTISAAASGNTLGIALSAPYSQAYAGVAQTMTFALLLNSTSGASVTAAASALVTYLNASSLFSTYYVASSAAGVVTITVNALSSPFAIGFTNGNFISVGLSGTVGNSLTAASTGTVGATVAVGNSGAFAGGTGFVGTIPVWVIGNY